MAYEFNIRIIYPLQQGDLCLRTDADWTEDLWPEQVSEDGTVFWFRHHGEEPFAYFKPVIRRGDAVIWSRGSNYLATLEASGDTEIYPFFFGDERGTVTPPLAIPGTSPEAGHLFRVYLPPGYEENHLKRYPVLYMHDGKNLFFPDEAFAGVEWQVDETLDLLDSMNAVEQVLVVGVYAQNRGREYTAPGYEDYGRLLVENLKGLIDERFRSLPKPEHTAVMGSSLGGVVSLFLAWRWPEVFGMAACLSSTFTWYDDLMRRVVEDPKPAIKLYLDSGWPGDNYEVTRVMRDLLLWKGFEAGSELLYLAFPRGAHNEHNWATRAHIPFQFFFGKEPSFGGEVVGQLTHPLEEALATHEPLPSPGLLRLPSAPPKAAAAGKEPRKGDESASRTAEPNNAAASNLLTVEGAEGSAGKASSSTAPGWRGRGWQEGARRGPGWTGSGWSASSWINSILEAAPRAVPALPGTQPGGAGGSQVAPRLSANRAGALESHPAVPDGIPLPGSTERARDW